MTLGISPEMRLFEERLFLVQPDEKLLCALVQNQINLCGGLVVQSGNSLDEELHPSEFTEPKKLELYRGMSLRS